MNANGIESETGQRNAGDHGREIEPAAVIDGHAFERDQKDPAWREFIRASEEHLDALERDGRSR